MSCRRYDLNPDLVTIDGEGSDVDVGLLAVTYGRGSKPYGCGSFEGRPERAVVLWCAHRTDDQQPTTADGVPGVSWQGA